MMVFSLWMQAASAYTCAILDAWDGPWPPPPSEVHYMCPDAVSPDCYTWDMSIVGDVEYRFNENDFTTLEMDEIELAADAWEGGWSKVNRGAWLELTRTQGAGDGSLDNGVNNVRRKPDSYFDAMSFENSDAFVMLYVDNNCVGLTEFDMTFREDTSNEVLDLPSRVAQGFSLGQLAVHEFGHAIGIGDDSSQLHVMDPRRPQGGDLGRTKFRVHEEDFYALRSLYPGNSTGGNLLLARFGWDDAAGDVVVERWTSAETQTRTWSACAGTTVGTGGPEQIQAVITGSVGFSASPLIRWTLEPDVICNVDGDEISVGTSQPGLGVHYPFEVFPTGGYQIPASTPPGTYRLCARINDDFAITETSYVDNVVRSEALFQVLSCP